MVYIMSLHRVSWILDLVLAPQFAISVAVECDALCGIFTGMGYQMIYTLLKANSATMNSLPSDSKYRIQALGFGVFNPGTTNSRRVL
jgi:hypothetical protein